MPKPIILLEFNEIVPQLIDRFIADGKLPNFEKFKNQSDVFTSTADEQQPPNLEPWIQWYSLHTGIPFSEHGVFRLTDGIKSRHNDIWRILASNGKRVINMSSMNARSFEPKHGSVYLPDPWCSAEKPFPSELEDYQRFVSHMVKEYSNSNSNISKLSARFIKMMATHGLSLSTAMDVLKQLSGEKLGGKRSTWQRATLLDAMQFDLFKYFYKKHNPDFSTFFINSTAHFQHAYWKDMDPGTFGISESIDSPHKNAVLYGYKAMDKLLGRFLKLAEKRNALLILSSGLSQQPFLDNINSDGIYYRFNNINKLMTQLNLQYGSIEPVMTNQYRITFDSSEDKNKAKSVFQNIMLDAKPILGVISDDSNQLFIGIETHNSISDSQIIEIPGRSSSKFSDIFYALDVSKSGKHHPDGVLWFRTGQYQAHAEKQSILNVLPTIISLQKIDQSKLDLHGNCFAHLLRPGAL